VAGWIDARYRAQFDLNSAIRPVRRELSSTTGESASFPLHTALDNGDVVEVITAPVATPNPAWLGFVRTGRARADHYLKSRAYAESEDLASCPTRMRSTSTCGKSCGAHRQLTRSELLTDTGWASASPASSRSG